MNRFFAMLPMLGLFVVGSFAQKQVAIPSFEIDEKTERVLYSEVVSTEGSAAVLYDKANGCTGGFTLEDPG